VANQSCIRTAAVGHAEPFALWQTPEGKSMRKAATNSERFWRNVQTSDDCWLWKGIMSKSGYGQFPVRPPHGGRRYKLAKAHRFAYELLIGPIPQGLVLDHFECDNPRCVNPAHLRPSTDKENILRGKGPGALNSRKSHCIRGHAFDETNTMWNWKGERNCRICKRSSDKRRKSAIPGFGVTAGATERKS
jgi:hypothetical protein